MKEHLLNLITSSGKPEVLVVGDLILDKFIWGQVDRISPEAPVQVVNVTREHTALGGAANVGHNLSAIGCKTTMVGVVGKDANGRILRSALKNVGLKDAVLIDAGRPTTTKTRVLAGSQHVVRMDHEDAGAISNGIEKRLITYLRTHVRKFKVVVISDYHKGLLTDRLLTSIISLCRKHGIPTIVDPKRKDLTAYAGATVIKPNAKEAEAAGGRKFTGMSAVSETARWIQKKFRIENVLITLGKEGMFLQQKSRSTPIRAAAREVFDVTGAGDTVIAFLARHLALGHSLEDAANIANIAAGIAVSRMGTVTVSVEEVLHEVHRGDERQKILSVEQLKRLLPSLRRDKKVVFTNGCFDILHVGHITLLGKARALGDLLIVGVNSDASIRRLKGPGRPIVSETERSHILAALEAVDHVVLFDEDTPISLIRALRPDILVKGSDYTVDQVVGGSFVRSYGGRVALVDLVVGFSTSNIIENILRSYSSEVNHRGRPKTR